MEAVAYKHTLQKYNLVLSRMQDYAAAPTKLNKASSSAASRILEQLPTPLLELEMPEVIVLTVYPEVEARSNLLAPHVDKIRRCCLNIYPEANKERTIFYRYNKGTMQEDSSFIAEAGQCWLLDAETPHAVELVFPHPRTVINVSFARTAYKDVYATLQEYFHG
jgi:hypothetical protein